MSINGTRPNVLVVDDDLAVRSLLEVLLAEWGYDVRSAADGHSGLELAEADVPDVAVLDIAMPGIDGYTLTRRLRTNKQTSRVPILLLSARLGGDDVARGLAAGADDYVRKPFDPQELRSRLETALRRAVFVEQLSDAAHIDPLTELPNRRTWDDRLAADVARSRRYGLPLSVGVVDVDKFKEFNDAHGHQAGDKLLVDASLAWRGQLREVDLLARYGGDEFGLLLPSCPLGRAAGVLERLRAATPGETTCCAGVAQWDGHETADAFVHRADQALTSAKRAGRDRVEIA